MGKRYFVTCFIDLNFITVDASLQTGEYSIVCRSEIFDKLGQRTHIKTLETSNCSDFRHGS